MLQTMVEKDRIDLRLDDDDQERWNELREYLRPRLGDGVRYIPATSVVKELMGMRPPGVLKPEEIEAFRTGKTRKAQKEKLARLPRSQQ